MSHKIDYRKRCYETFVSNHWEFSHEFSIRAYDMYAEVSKKRYKGLLPANKDAQILDVACGTGHFLYFLKEAGYKNIVGIDIGKEQLEVAKKIGIKNIERADLFAYLPEKKRSFDLIIANDIIEHFGKNEAIVFLDLIFDSLKSGGRTLISTVNAQSLFGAATVSVDYTHEQGFTATSLCQVLRVCRFRDVRVYGEGPVVHDMRSAVRASLWWITTKFLASFYIIERGTGRGAWKNQMFFEPRIFAIGKKL